MPQYVLGHLDRVEDILKKEKVKAFKAYLGYLHHGPDSPRYGPYYELAARYKVPFIFHSGDTYSHLAKVKFAHPLLVDEVAVDHPKVQFVIAHVGNPWLTDAAARGIPLRVTLQQLTALPVRARVERVFVCENPAVLRAAPQARILVLSMRDEPATVRAAFAAGASGYVLKEAADTELVAP